MQVTYRNMIQYILLSICNSQYFLKGKAIQ